MTSAEIEAFEKQYRNSSAQEIIKFAVDTFGKNLAFATSLAYEDQVVTHILCGLTKQVEIFTLDTGRLFQETYDTIEKTEQFYGITIRKMFPDTFDVETMVNTHGVNLFYKSVELRKLCCEIRKTRPLQRALAGKQAWITGLRREQSVTRYALKVIEFDAVNNLIKINPLANWTEQQVLAYIEENNIPYNQLQKSGYRSIGCLPCTRPVSADEDFRAGRWWWEQPEQKECGLHQK